MRLSTKLKISFGFLIILPVALFGTVLFSITKIQLHRIQENMVYRTYLMMHL